MIALVGVQENLGRAIRAQSPELDVAEVSAPEELTSMMRKSRSNVSVDAVVIGSGCPNPIEASQRVRSLTPDAALVICTSGDDSDEVSRTLRFTPLLPKDVRCVPSTDYAAIANEVRAAAERTQRRRRMQVALHRASGSLRTAAPPSLAPTHIDRLMDAAPIGMLVLDEEGHVVVANRAAEEMGFAVDTSGRRFVECFDARQRTRVIEALDWSNESDATIRVSVEQPGPGARRLELSIVRTTLASGEAGTLVMVQDATARIEAQRALEAALENEQAARRELDRVAADLFDSERRLRLALAAGRMGAWRWDRATNRVHWSESLEELYGLKPGEFGGTYESFFSFVHPEDRDYVGRAVAAAATSGPHYEIEFRIIRADGAERWIADRGEVLHDADGSFCGITGICWDSTEEHKAAAERARLAAEIESARALLDTLFEHAPVGLGFWDRDLRYVRVNQALAEINGISPEEHVGKMVAELLPQLDAGVTDALRSVVETGQPILDQEASGYTPAAPHRLRYWSVSYYPVRVGGEILGVGAVCEEITRRKEAEAEIRQALRRESDARSLAQAAEARATFLAQASAVLSASLDYEEALLSVASLAVPEIADWCVVDMLDEHGRRSRVAAEHVEPEKAALARSLDEKYPPRPEDPLSVVLATGEAQLVPRIAPETIRAAAQDAEHLRILEELGLASYIIVPIRFRDRVVGAVSFVSSSKAFDASDLLLATELANRASAAMENATLYRTAEDRRKEAEKAAEELRRLNEELEQFAYIASHDLQEPLRTIASYTQLLAREYGGRLEPSADEYIDRVIKGVMRMRALISDLLDYSRVSRDELETREAVDMNGVVDEVSQALEASIQQSGATIVRDSLPRVRVTRSQAVQLVQNILSNAIKYRRAGVAPEIAIGATRRGAECEFAIRDNGQGFEPEYAEQVFGIFKRLHGKDIPGTGIGLALCKRIVERHGGSIRATSTPGQGSTFFFTLPCVEER